jgi:integrase
MVVKKRLNKMELSKALQKYYTTVSIYHRGQMQEFYRVNVICSFPLARKKMDEISSVDIADYRDMRLACINKRTGKPISGNTVRLELAMLSSLYNLARIEWGTCNSNPVEFVRKPRVSCGRTRRLLSCEEQRLSWFFKSRNQELSTILHLALETAMRQGELLSLRWENIDLQQGIAHLPMTKNGTSRDVPLSSKARTLLREMPSFGPVAGPVFSYTSNGLKSAWRTAVIALGIDDLHFHDLRHEAISRLFELGTLNVIEIAAISGHKSLNMLKRYTHLNATHLVRKLDTNKRGQKFVGLFVPYPVEVLHAPEGVTLRFGDLENLSISAPTKDAALKKASDALLRLQANAAKSGKRLPPPGTIDVKDTNRILINPL